jgi:hypothetical protein
MSHRHNKASECCRFSEIEKYLKSLNASKIKSQWLNGFGIRGEIKTETLNLKKIKDLCNDNLCLCTIRVNYEKVILIFHDEIEYFYEKENFFESV